MEFNIVDDIRSHLKFAIRQNSNFNIDFPLIDWTKQFLHQNYNFVDIGANIGSYSCILSPHCHTVHAFECSPVTLKELQLSIEINKIDNIEIHPYALSNEEKLLSFYVNDGYDEGFYKISNDAIACNAKPLDYFCLENISFIKINVSGAELQVLQGALKTLKSNRYPPIMFKSVKNDNLLSDKNEELMTFIRKLGYNVHSISGCSGVYLASDHPQYSLDNNNKPEKYKQLIDIFNNNKNDISTLTSLMVQAEKYHDYNIGLEVCDKLIFSNHPEKSEALINIYKYIEQIPYINKINLNCPMKKTRVPNNPSMINLPNGDYLCNVRCSNYIYEPHFQFLEGNIHLSDHILLTLSPNFMVKKMVELVDKTNNVYYDSFVKGFDDLRLIDSTRFICSHGNFNNHRTIEQCLGTYDEFGNVNKLIVLKGPNPHRHEKNWIPLIQNDELFIVYFFNPFTLYKVNEETGELTLVSQKTLVEHFDVKGSSSFIEYKGGLLATVHHTTRDLSYMQRFIWMNKELTTLKYSKPFYFESKGVEFTLSMCHGDNCVIIPNSIRDNYANLKMIDYKVVDAYLNI
jgi:FkbM family methyltransferase